jgi:hypothetical protein
VSERPDRYRKHTFIVHEVGGVIREYDGPRILADFFGCHEGEFRCLVAGVGEFGKPTAPHNGTIGRDDLDRSFA